MYNLESQFKKFYGKHVVLPGKEKKALLSKKNINIKRLKDGLEKYTVNGKQYKLAEEPIIQGSVAMATVTQNDSKDYDIDVAIVFEKDELPDGTTATKNIVKAVLKEVCKNFKVEPEAKTNCIRIVYAEGYHIDFAIYRRYKDGNGQYIYDHCGSEWRERNPRSINKWFMDENKAKDYKLREIVRLLKIFSKSRDSWKNMPGGLILSVLANEEFRDYERMDECFYHTLVAIRDRLAWNKEVYNPTDQTKTLKLVEKDNIKMENLYKRLDKEIKKLDILFDEENCNLEKALEAWEGFFCHPYWTKLKENAKNGELVSESTIIKAMATQEEEYHYYKETEEYIDHLMPVVPLYNVSLNCEVTRDGKEKRWLKEMNRNNQNLKTGYDLKFIAKTDAPEPFNVYWKVRNKGSKAKKHNAVRGQIKKTDLLTQIEDTSFSGNHYVECYIVKDGVCVAKERINVPIG